MTLQLADGSIIYPEGKIEDVLVKVDKLIFPADFIGLDYMVKRDMPIILGRPFLATSNTLIDVQKGELTMGFKDEHVTFNVFNSIKSLKENENFLKAKAVKEDVNRATVDCDLKDHYIDPGEIPQKFSTEIDIADQFGGTTMLKAPPWCHKSISPQPINQDLSFTPRSSDASR
ncbi:uncharacterized protein G2W53_014598 [Senna tora]|uniref:Uncharacterized protein n=1 Tax=Senna tora TaxID=362788 RepID=A0A834WTR5_9FABA|nr:uncharacterized protein G2W53_014598 [Senna tora]